MAKPPHNPFAFPLVTSNGMIHGTGMTLRDWFAGQALMGMLANTSMPVSADVAYAHADAMLEEREK